MVLPRRAWRTLAQVMRSPQLSKLEHQMKEMPRDIYFGAFQTRGFIENMVVGCVQDFLSVLHKLVVSAMRFV